MVENGTKNIYFFLTNISTARIITRKKRGTKESQRNTFQNFQHHPIARFRETGPTKSIFGARKRPKNVVRPQKWTDLAQNSRKLIGSHFFLRDSFSDPKRHNLKKAECSETSCRPILFFVLKSLRKISLRNSVQKWKSTKKWILTASRGFLNIL